MQINNKKHTNTQFLMLFQVVKECFERGGKISYIINTEEQSVAIIVILIIYITKFCVD